MRYDDGYGHGWGSVSPRGDVRRGGGARGGFGGGYGRGPGYPGGPLGGGYFGGEGLGGAWGGYEDDYRAGPAGYDEPGAGGYGDMQYGRWDQPRRDYGGERGVYGGAYPGFGGYPGAPRSGDYYGGGGYGPGRPSRERGYDRGWGGFAREPFLPEEAYRRHPELSERPHARRWEEHVHQIGDDLSDDEIHEAVIQRMYDDPWLDVRTIDVDVDDGIVTLTGEVGDFLEARYAWDDAWEAEGVRGVVNHLTVRTDLPQPAREVHGDLVIQNAGYQTSAGEAGGG